MNQPGIYKSTASEQIMRQWYDRFKDCLDYSVEQRSVMTSSGHTNVLITGPEKGIPIICLHGGLAGAPHALRELGDFPKNHRIYAVDIIGQSPASEQIRPDVKSDAFAHWLNEVLAELQLDAVILMGVSWGGFIALNMASHFPEKVKGMILVNSASIIKGSAWKAITKVSFPLLWFKLFPTDKNRDWAYRAILTTPHELWSPFIADAMKHTKMDFSAPPLVDPSRLKSLKAPVFVFAADNDLSFPGRQLIQRAQEIFPNLIGTHLFENCHHCPPFEEAFTEKFALKLDQVIESMNGSYAEATRV